MHLLNAPALQLALLRLGDGTGGGLGKVLEGTTGD